jgi:hypothetical protein
MPDFSIKSPARQAAAQAIDPFLPYGENLCIKNFAAYLQA